jgi:hypothetical protein
MMRILSEGESAIMRNEEALKASEWWDDLKFEDQKMIYDHYEKLIKQKYCTHKNINKHHVCPDCDLPNIT